MLNNAVPTTSSTTLTSTTTSFGNATFQPTASILSYIRQPIDMHRLRVRLQHMWAPYVHAVLKGSSTSSQSLPIDSVRFSFCIILVYGSLCGFMGVTTQAQRWFAIRGLGWGGGNPSKATKGGCPPQRNGWEAQRFPGGGGSSADHQGPGPGWPSWGYLMANAN